MNRKQVYFAVDQFDDWLLGHTSWAYVPKWVHRVCCLIWGHCGIKMPNGNYCAYCQKDRPAEECS